MAEGRGWVVEEIREVRARLKTQCGGGYVNSCRDESK